MSAIIDSAVNQGRDRGIVSASLRVRDFTVIPAPDAHSVPRPAGSGILTRSVTVRRAQGPCRAAAMETVRMDHSK